jgi:hypothetical protein
MTKDSEPNGSKHSLNLVCKEQYQVTEPLAFIKSWATIRSSVKILLHVAVVLTLWLCVTTLDVSVCHASRLRHLARLCR